MQQLLATWLPEALAMAALSCCLIWYSAVDTVILCCLCLLSVSVARVLQARLQWSDGRQPPAGSRSTRRALLIIGGTIALTTSLLLVKTTKSTETGRDGELSVLSHWYLAVTAVLLAVAFEVSGTARAELADARAERQTNYSEGAAWLFFLGYLDKIFGEGGMRFLVRMEDYLSANEINEEGQKNTCKDKLFILLPMTRAAVPSDRSFETNDSTVSEELPLRRAAEEGVRRYGEMRVYQVEYGGEKYRVSMEVATPLRTACLAVLDTDADFNDEDYKEFALRFLTTLEEILVNIPAVRSQCELVPIIESNKLGSTVVERFLKIRQLKNAEAEL